MTIENPIEARHNRKLIMRCDVKVRHRRRVELMIARKAIRELRKAGYELTADNGEDKATGSDRQLIDCLFACDEAHLYASNGTGVTSWVYFVLGNDGYDVVSDYSTTLEPVMKVVNDYATKLEEDGR